MKNPTTHAAEPSHFDELQLVYKAIHSAEDEAGLELPLHNCLVLEVRLKTSFLNKESLSEEAAYLEGISHLLHTLIWLQSKNLLTYEIVTLKGIHIINSF